jgi:uncharacterized OB-fold protein
METPRHWRLKKQHYAMAGSQCQACGTKLFPFRPVCPVCGSAVNAPAHLMDKVEVYPLEAVFGPKPAQVGTTSRQVPALVENRAS